MHLKLLQKEQLKEIETTGDLIGDKILHHKIIQKKMKKKYLEKDIYLQKKTESYWWSKINIIIIIIYNNGISKNKKLIT